MVFQSTGLTDTHCMAKDTMLGQSFHKRFDTNLIYVFSLVAMVAKIVGYQNMFSGAHNEDFCRNGLKRAETKS